MQLYNKVSRKMDLMESELFNAPIILLQTVMEEVRHRSLPLFNRLKSLTKIDGKTMWIFYNEFNAWVPKISIEY
jgi:exosome complex exonuclease DIS3/RRP44